MWLSLLSLSHFSFLGMGFDWCRCSHGSSFTRNQRQTWKTEALVQDSTGPD